MVGIDQPVPKRNQRGSQRGERGEKSRNTGVGVQQIRIDGKFHGTNEQNNIVGIREMAISCEESDQVAGTDKESKDEKQQKQKQVLPGAEKCYSISPNMIG